MASTKTGFAKNIGITVGSAVVGWGLCGATMFLAMAATTPARALIIHAVAAPFIFAAISFFYFRCLGAWSPLAAACSFLGVVAVMDLFVVAVLIEKSFKMFESLAGTWLPFLLIFLSTWWTGRALRRAKDRAA